MVYTRAMEAITLISNNSEVKPKPVSGVVTLELPACRAFAANEPRWHRGCSDCSYDDASETIVYNHFRYYDPATGRYERPDPRGIMLDFSDPSRQVAFELGISIPNLSYVNSLNQNYAYAGQNPLMYMDSTGEFIGKAINLAFQWCVRSKLSCAAVGGGIAGKNIADRLERQELCELACTNQCPVGASDSLFDGSKNFTAFSDTNDPSALTGCKAQCVRDIWSGKPGRSPLPNRL